MLLQGPPSDRAAVLRSSSLTLRASLATRPGWGLSPSYEFFFAVKTMRFALSRPQSAVHQDTLAHETWMARTWPRLGSHPSAPEKLQALVAARQSGIPTVALQHSVHSVLTGAFGAVFDTRLEEINDYAADLGVGNFPSSVALMEGPPLVLVFSYRSFDPVETFAPNVVHVGPLGSRMETKNAWNRRMPSRPLVVVSLVPATRTRPRSCNGSVTRWEISTWRRW